MTAMVYMADSDRAAQLAKANAVDAGLHLNLTEAFSAKSAPEGLRERHARVARFLRRSKYAPLLYNPALRNDFHYVYKAQVEEFVQRYGQLPTHIDGHQHQHLCANIVWDRVIPKGQKVRRTFHFWPGEKSWANRAYRGMLNAWLKSRYRGTDYFFALPQCFDAARLARVRVLARESTVELMTHPVNAPERSYLAGEGFRAAFDGIERGSYDDL